MTGSNVRETRSPSCSGSTCSEDGKSSYVQCPSEKNKKNVASVSGSDKSGATDTKSEVPEVQSRKKSSELLKSSSISVPPRSASRFRSQKAYNGILDPSLLASKRAQWLSWNDPAFTRRRSIEERLCKRITTQTVLDQKNTVTSFKRSLQLLGLKEKDLGLNDTSKDKNNEYKISRGRATPTFSTQLKQRSVSLTNLRNAVQESGLPTFEAIEKMHRDILSRAVYEEWYFKKLTEYKIRKELEEEIKKEHEKELEWIKLERKKKAEENFEKWKKMKDQIKKDKSKEETIKSNKSTSYAKIKPGCEEAFKAWKVKKDEEIKAKVDLKKRLEREEKINNEIKEKKAAADAAFKAWKQKIDAEIKNKLKEKEREEKLAAEKKEKENKDKKESAQMCYIKWKKEKDKDIKEKIHQKRINAKKDAEESTKRQKEREYEAAQAFEEWLDEIEEREQKFKTSKNSLNSEIPPWYPA